jgi:hypothetical protein
MKERTHENQDDCNKNEEEEKDKEKRQRRICKKGWQRRIKRREVKRQ